MPARKDMTMEPMDSKRARILDRQDMITAITVAIVILVINATLLIILF
jgi:hypothetical protein